MAEGLARGPKWSAAAKICAALRPSEGRDDADEPSAGRAVEDDDEEVEARGPKRSAACNIWAALKPPKDDKRCESVESRMPDEPP